MTAKWLPFSLNDLASISAIDLPANQAEMTTDQVRVTWVSRAPGRLSCEIIGHRLSSKGGQLKSIDIRLSDGSIIRVGASTNAVTAGVTLLEASSWTISDQYLIAEGQVKWRRSISDAGHIDSAARSTVKDSWKDGVNFSTRPYEQVREGLRLPQRGALHAIAAHWSVKAAPARVIMPTGTGKTDTMVGL